MFTTPAPRRPQLTLCYWVCLFMMPVSFCDKNSIIGPKEPSQPDRQLETVSQSYTSRLLRIWKERRGETGKKEEEEKKKHTQSVDC